MKKLMHLIICKVKNITENDNIDEKIVRNALLYVVSSIIGLRRLQVKHNNNLSYINFFGVTFSNSGSGKDVALKVCENVFDTTLKNYVKALKIDYKSLHGAEPIIDLDANDEKNYIVPTAYNVPVRGSIEGMMRVANFFNEINLGSLNVKSDEFGHDINKENLSLLTKLWQDGGSGGSVNVNEKYNPIFNVPTNILLYGSYEPFKSDSKKYKELIEILKSGLIRRSFFVFSDDKDKVFLENRIDVDDILLKEYAFQIKEHIKSFENTILEKTPEAQLLLKQFIKDAMNKYNKEKSFFNEMRTTIANKIARLAGVIAIIRLQSEIDEQSMQQAIDITNELDDSLQLILEPPRQYKLIYNELLKSKKPLSITELIDKGIEFKNKSDREEQLNLLSVYVFQKSKKLIERKVSSTSLYKIIDLPKTDIKEIIVGISSNLAENPSKEVYYENVQIPFFGKEKSIESLVNHKSFKSFVTCHFENDRKREKYGYRRKDKFIEGQNLIAFDIDEGLSLNDAKQLLEQYTYLIYTTKSHQVDKNGIICDRFRILLPTKTEFFVNAEQHKQLYENLSKMLNIPSYDTATRNVSRMWFINPNATIYINKADLLDVSCCLPDTDRAEQTRYISKEELDEQTNDIRIQGMIRWVLTNTVQGNRNNNLFKFKKFLDDLKEPADGLLYYVNNMLSEPLPEIEIKSILRR